MHRVTILRRVAVLPSTFRFVMPTAVEADPWVVVDLSPVLAELQLISSVEVGMATARDGRWCCRLQMYNYNEHELRDG